MHRWNGRRRAHRFTLLLTALLLLAGCGGVKPEAAPEEPVARPEAGQNAGKAASDGAAEPDQLAVKPLPGYRAADFRATDVATGETVTLADLQGQVVFLNFWATWCPPCKEEMPDMQELHQEMGEKVRIVALGADGREAPEKMARFAEAMGLTFTVVHDHGSAAGAYQVRGVPTSFFIDKEGVIRTRYTGPMTREQMKEYVDQAAKATESQPEGKPEGQP